jgi:hypothetical protein
VEHVACLDETRNTYNNLSRNPERKRPLEMLGVYKGITLNGSYKKWGTRV